MKSLKILSVMLAVLLINLFSPNSVYSQHFYPTGGGLFQNNSSTNMDLQVGTSFSTGFGGNSFFTHSIAPNLNWNASENFVVQAGTIFTLTSFSGSQQNNFLHTTEATGNHSLFQSNLYGNLSYAIGYYQISDNLTFMGGAYLETSNFSQHLEMNSQAFNMDTHGMLMGFEYKINENMRVGAEFNMRSGSSPYSYQRNPFNTSPGFRQNPFNNNPTGW